MSGCVKLVELNPLVDKVKTSENCRMGIHDFLIRGTLSA